MEPNLKFHPTKFVKASGNQDVAKASQLTIIKLMKENFLRYFNISLPAYWFTYGVTHALGLFSFKDYAIIRNNRVGNLQFYLEESLRFGFKDEKVF